MFNSTDVVPVLSRTGLGSDSLSLGDFVFPGLLSAIRQQAEREELAAGASIVLVAQETLELGGDVVAGG